MINNNAIQLPIFNKEQKVLKILTNVPIYNYQRINCNLSLNELMLLCGLIHKYKTKGVFRLNGVTENEPVPRIKADSCFDVKNAILIGMTIYADIYIYDKANSKEMIEALDQYNIGFDVKILTFAGEIAPLYCLASISGKVN